MVVAPVFFQFEQFCLRVVFVVAFRYCFQPFSVPSREESLQFRVVDYFMEFLRVIDYCFAKFAQHGGFGMPYTSVKAVFSKISAAEVDVVAGSVEVSSARRYECGEICFER